MKKKRERVKKRGYLRWSGIITLHKVQDWEEYFGAIEQKYLNANILTVKDNGDVAAIGYWPFDRCTQHTRTYIATFHCGRRMDLIEWKNRHFCNSLILWTHQPSHSSYTFPVAHFDARAQFFKWAFWDRWSIRRSLSYFYIRKNHEKRLF